MHMPRHLMLLDLYECFLCKPCYLSVFQGIQRQFSAIVVLQSVESFFHTSGASSKLNASSFAVDVRTITLDFLFPVL